MTEENSASATPFRQQALEYISAPRALESFIQNPSFSAWTLLIGLSLLILALIVWIFCGSIVVQQRGRGMMLSEQVAIVYVSALHSLKIQPEMTAWVSLSSQGKGLAKPIQGQVVSVDNLPVTPENALDTLKNQSLVNYFLHKDPVISVRVHTLENIGTGTLIDVRINLSRQTPWALLVSRHPHG